MNVKGFLKFAINVLFLYFWKVLYTFIKRVNDCEFAADRLHKCEWPWQPSELFYFLDKLKDVAGQQLGLFEGSKVSTSRHERVRVDFAIPNLRQGLWTVHQFSWKGCKSSGHKNSCPRIKYLTVISMISWKITCNEELKNYKSHTWHQFFFQYWSLGSLCRSAWRIQWSLWSSISWHLSTGHPDWISWIKGSDN